MSRSGIPTLSRAALTEAYQAPIVADRLERADRARAAKGNLITDQQRLQDVRDALDLEVAVHERRKQDVLVALAHVVERDELLKERDRLRAA
ncbi:MAG: hypothetical protein E5X65_33565 [Mesorhizobium sp.]|nr:MAG: hypothetical protein E5X65_33565 [Mesorhizobium sp.]